MTNRKTDYNTVSEQWRIQRLPERRLNKHTQSRSWTKDRESDHIKFCPTQDRVSQDCNVGSNHLQRQKAAVTLLNWTHNTARQHSVQFSSVAQSCLTLCDPMNRSTPGLPHQLPESTQTHAHWVGDAIQPSHPLSSPSPPAPNPSQQQGPFQWVNSLHQVAKVLEFQLQHQSFQWIPRTDLL